MKPCGIIITYIDWRKVKKWFFNIPLFLWQLTFMIVGTVYGKIKWGKKKPGFADYTVVLICFLGIIACLTGVAEGIAGGVIVLILLLYLSATLFFILVATIHSIPWRRVWRAAQACHVRLVLEEPDPENYPGIYLTANFGHPKMEVQPWQERWNDGKRFRYFDPTFDPSPVFIEKMIGYAEDQVGKEYDDLQLISNGLHLIAWIIYPPCWGREIKVIKALNRKGGREHCTSGLTACLRWADNISPIYDATDGALWIAGIFDYPYYDTAVVPPCLVDLSENWRGNEERKIEDS